jgi:hypothetical protein
MRRAWLSLKASRVTEMSILVLICLVAVSGWLDPGLPKGHDAIGTIVSAEQIRAFLSNAGYLSCHSHWALGAFQIDTPQFYYFPVALSFLFSWSMAAKVYFFLIYALSGLFAYLFALEVTKSRLAGFVAGLAYTFAPYYLIEVVFEGHWTIGAQYMLTPLVFLATEKAIQRPGAGRVVLAGLSVALLVGLGHPQTLPILVGPFLGLYMLFRIWQSHKEGAGVRVIACLAIFLTGLALTAYWWLPLLREISYFQAPYSIEASESYKGTFLQVLTLRPSLCCAPSSAYEAAASGFSSVLLFLPSALAIVGAVLNYRNRYVWFFSAAVLISWLLAMGSSAPIDLFGLAHRHIPFFSGLRTPVRFLLFTCFSYAVLTGFCIKGALDWLDRADLTKLRRYGAMLLIVVPACLILTANTWSEARAAFSTFRLSDDQNGALAFLAQQEDGQYYVADYSFDIYKQNPDSRYIVNPVYWTFAHGKQTLPGGLPPSNRYTVSLTGALINDLSMGSLDMSQWLAILNVRYLVIDKSEPLSSNVSLNEHFERVWTSDTLDIYENHSMEPRLFSFSTTDQRYIQLWNNDRICLRSAEGGDVGLALDAGYVSSDNVTLKATFRFTEPQGQWLNLAVDVGALDFDEDDSIHLAFYSDRDLPDIYMSLDVFEQDGSRYGMDINRDDVIKAGWNEIDLPISLLSLRHSTDENGYLDPDQIETLWFGPGERVHQTRSHEFDLYFTAPSVVSYDMGAPVEYTEIRPGRYEVHVSLDSPSCLVLSEAYHPNWVARVNGKTIHSQLVYQALNGFYLEAGEYDVTLEFANSPLRTAGNIITIAAIIILLLLGVFFVFKKWHGRRQRQQHYSDPGELREPSS